MSDSLMESDSGAGKISYMSVAESGIIELSLKFLLVIFLLVHEMLVCKSLGDGTDYRQ